jgi:hypothetical protein
VLLADGFLLLRAAIALTLIAVVMVALALALRPAEESARAEAEELVFGEIDALRGDVREDISHAARATHKALSEQIGSLSETVQGLRGQLDALRGQVERMPQLEVSVHEVPSPPGNGGILHHTETVQVLTRKTTVVDQNDR